jgi:hypothetical protein
MTTDRPDLTALQEIRGLATANRVELTRHARKRMVERGVTYRDVQEALMTARRCTAQSDDRWRVEGGHDVLGEPLALIVVIAGAVVVITMM